MCAFEGKHVFESRARAGMSLSERRTGAVRLPRAGVARAAHGAVGAIPGDAVELLTAASTGAPRCGWRGHTALCLFLCSGMRARFRARARRVCGSAGGGGGEAGGRQDVAGW